MTPKRPITPLLTSGTDLPEASERVLHILGEAAALFAERGYDRTSMRDLAERCGVSKSLLYHHFADKEEIYTRIALGFMGELHDYVTAQIPSEGTVRLRVGVFMTATARFFERHRLVWLASTEAFWTDPQLRGNDERLRWRRAYEGLLRNLLTEGMRTGELTAMDVPMAGRLVLSAMNWLPRWYRAGGPQSAEDIAAGYHRMIFDGLTAPAPAPNQPVNKTPVSKASNRSGTRATPTRPAR